MHVLIIGRDSYTHALSWKLTNSPALRDIVFAPGNGGTTIFGPSAELSPSDSGQIAHFVISESIDLVVLDADAISSGVAEEVRPMSVPVFGADCTLANLQRNRCALREWLQQQGLPVARGRSCTSQAQAEKYAATLPHPLLIAADAPDGPAIVCRDRTEVPGAIAECLAGTSGVIVEELIAGPVITAAFLFDGAQAVALPPVRLYLDADHPYAAITGVQSAATPIWTRLDQFLQQVRDRLATALRATGAGVRGWISARCVAGARGLVVQSIGLVPSGFEAAAAMLRLDSDLLPLLSGTAHGTLAQIEPPRWRSDAVVGVGLLSAAGSVPDVSPATIDMFEPGVIVFHHATSVASPNTYVPRAIRQNGSRLSFFDLNSLLRPPALVVDDTTAEPLVALVATAAADRAAARARLYASLERSAIPAATYRGDVGLREL